MMAQARHRRGKGRGGKSKGRGHKGGSYGASPASPLMPGPAGGHSGGRPSNDDERTARLKELKKKTQCLDCGRFWSLARRL